MIISHAAGYPNKSLAVLFDWCFEAKSILNTELERGVPKGRPGHLKVLEIPAAARGQGDPSAVIWLDDQIAPDNPTSAQT